MDEDVKSVETEPKVKTKSKSQKAEAKRLYLYRIDQKEREDYGNYPEKMIGIPLEQCLYDFMKRMSFPDGNYHADVRGGRRNSLLDSWTFDFVNSQQSSETSQKVIEFEPEEFDFDDDEIEMPSNDSALKAKIFYMEQRLKDVDERERQQREAMQSSQSETLSLIREMQKQSEKSFQQGLQLAQMLMRSQNSQASPTQMMLEMLQGTLAVQKGVKELSEEISPPRTESGNLLDGAANLIDSITRNAPKILPVVAGLGGIRSNTSSRSETATQANTAAASNGNGATSNLAEMFSKINQSEKSNEQK